VHYSGTMGVVMEGCMKGIPSIGFSLCDFDRDADFSAMSEYVRAIVSRVLREGLPERVCLNVNFPKRSSYLGVKVCRMSKGKWTNEWFKMDHPHGQSYYWLTGEFINTEPDMQDTDTWALVNGFVAVTPIQVDMTAYSAMSGLKDLENL
jgi:5'-nucleotidase